MRNETIYLSLATFAFAAAILGFLPVYAQDTTNATSLAPTTNATTLATEGEQMAMVLTLEDSRNGATYQYTINSTQEIGPILNSVLQAGNPQGAGTQSLEGDVNAEQVDAFVAGISSLEEGAGTASLGEDEAGVTGFFSKFTKVVKKAVEIGTKVGPIAVKLAPLLL